MLAIYLYAITVLFKINILLVLFFLCGIIVILSSLSNSI